MFCCAIKRLSGFKEVNKIKAISFMLSLKHIRKLVARVERERLANAWDCEILPRPEKTSDDHFSVCNVDSDGRVEESKNRHQTRDSSLEK